MKRGLIVYASVTGNTKKVAEAMQQAMPDFFDVAAMEDNVDPSAYELVVAGYWVNRGAPPSKSRSYMERITDKPVVLFQTIGADPVNDVSHVFQCCANGGAFLGKNCHVLGVYTCQGEISQVVIEHMKSLGAKSPHAATPENMARWASATGHPNEDDLMKAQSFIQQMVSVYERFYNKVKQ